MRNRAAAARKQAEQDERKSSEQIDADKELNSLQSWFFMDHLGCFGCLCVLHWICVFWYWLTLTVVLDFVAEDFVIINIKLFILPYM